MIASGLTRRDFIPDLRLNQMELYAALSEYPAALLNGKGIKPHTPLDWHHAYLKQMVHFSIVGALYQLRVPLPDKLPDLDTIWGRVICFYDKKKLELSR